MDSRRYTCDTDHMGRPATGQTPLRNLRAPDDEWKPFRAASEGNMTTLLRQFIRWYLRRPGAELPDRPSEERLYELLAQAETDQAKQAGAAGESEQR